MPEETGKNSEEQEAQGNWFDNIEAITSNADLLKHVGKYKDPGALAKSNFELEKKMGSSYRLPDDLKTLTPEQRAELMSKAISMRDIPAEPADYEITIPEGVPKDEAFLSAFQALAHERKFDKADTQAIADFYHNAVLGRMQTAQQKQEQDAKAAETQFRINEGMNYEQTMEGIKRARMAITEKLGLGYTNDKGELCSKLDDALDMMDATGRRLGNQIPILLMLKQIYKDNYSEGEPIPGSPGGAGAPKSDGYPDYKKM